jgi:alpha-beta hydrolase superfamily lysophospholipase
VTSVARPLGITTLLYAYRNDAGAPRSPDGIYRFGLSEWRDLDAASRPRGATAPRIILAAQSMGGAILGQYLRHAPHAGDVIAAVLDAPALDLRATLQHFVAAKRLPLSGAVTWTATQITPGAWASGWTTR